MKVHVTYAICLNSFLSKLSFFSNHKLFEIHLLQDVSSHKKKAKKRRRFFTTLSAFITFDLIYCPRLIVFDELISVHLINFKNLFKNF